MACKYQPEAGSPLAWEDVAGDAMRDLHAPSARGHIIQPQQREPDAETSLHPPLHWLAYFLTQAAAAGSIGLINSF